MKIMLQHFNNPLFKDMLQLQKNEKGQESKYMSLTSTYFIIFMLILVPVYYLVPKKIQWFVLLAASLVFYAFGGLFNIFYVLFTSLTVYCGTRFMDKLNNKQKEYLKANKENLSRDEKKAYKAKIKSKRKTVMLCSILLNLAVLVFFKFLYPFNSLLSYFGKDALSIIMPLGISYYTLQAIGYAVDVYWGNAECEKNYLKVLLFVSFFPQVTQGPISDFKQLSNELFTEHEFTYKNYSWGFQRLIWGFFKKMVIANLMLPYVKNLFENYASYSGLTLFIGIFVVMVQLYADFSGYMDIVCGVCEMLGIKLSENFNGPFFSKSLSEFWRRWHITLGAWFKKYVFFTVGTSRLANSISGKVKNKFGADAGEKTVSTVALLAIWFSIGIWHSVNLPFVLWGLLNGVIMIISVWLEPVYTSVKSKLHINDKAKPWKLFQMARTFTLVSALEVFSDAGTLKDGTGYLVQIFKSALGIPKSFAQLFPYVENRLNFGYLFIGLVFILAFSIVGRQKTVRVYFNKIPIIVRILILSVVFFLIIIIGVPIIIENGGGFLYEQF